MMAEIQAMNARAYALMRNRAHDSAEELSAQILAELGGRGVTRVSFEPDFTGVHLTFGNGWPKPTQH